MSKKAEKEIPEAIKEAFAFESANFKGKIERLGVKDGAEWFRFAYSEDLEIGYPTVYGLKDGALLKISGEEALDFVLSSGED